MMTDHSGILRQPNELADLHIFVVPEDLWLEKYRTAFNNIALESVSAGFVRIQPYVSLKYLRDHIEEQLGPDVVPEDYVFLRSVGRCMAVVKENQERLLKAKDFLPPVSFTPEIFILPGTHESVARPVETAPNTVIQTSGLTTAGMASVHQPHHFPGISAGHMQYPQAFPNVLTGGYPPVQQSGQVDQIGLQRRDLEDFEKSDIYDVNSEDDNGSNKERDVEREASGQHLTSKNEGRGSAGESDRELSFDERDHKLKHRKGFQVEYEEMTNTTSLKAKKSKMHKKSSSSSSGSNQSEQRTVKFIQPEVYQSLPFPGAMISPATPIPSGRVIVSPFPAQQGDKEMAPYEREELSHDKKIERKGSKKKHRDMSQSPPLEQKQHNDLPNHTQKENQEINEEQFHNADTSTVYGEVTVSRVEPSPTLSEVQERSKFVQFPSPMKGTSQPDLPNDHAFEDGNTLVNELHDLDGEFGEESSLARSDFDNRAMAQKDTAAKNGDADVEQNAKEFSSKVGKAGVLSKDNNDGAKAEDFKGTGAKGKKTAKKLAAKKPTENLEDKYKIPEIPKVPAQPTVNYQKEQVEKGFGRDTASAKDKKQHEIEELRAELRKAKNARVDMEKQREGKVRRAKILQNQMMQKRNQSRNIWKKRFFDEKRKTGALDEQVNRLRHEVDVQHKALMSYLESKEREGNKPAVGNDYKSPSEKTNQRMSLARLQHEVEELKRKMEELKMKLTVEMKNRDAAQKELKQIRQELMEKKINLTLTKSQKSLTTLTNPENIAV